MSCVSELTSMAPTRHSDVTFDTREWGGTEYQFTIIINPLDEKAQSV
jgi:hypothetical protein